MKMQRKQIIGIVILLFGVVLAVLASIIGFVVAPIIIDDQIEKQTILVEDSEVWDKWVEIPVPIYFKVYMFHIANAEEMRKNWSVVPILEERGPYVYREKRVKDFIVRKREGEERTLTYKPKTKYEFVREMSIGDDSDKLDMFNAPFLTLAYLLATKLPLMPQVSQELLSRLILDHNESLILTSKVRDYIFEGVPMPHYLPIERLVGVLNIKLPHEIGNGKFAVYREVRKNDTYYEGTWEVHTGETDVSKVNTLKRVDGNRRSPFWRDDISPYCGMINGSDGTTHPPFMEKENRLYAFAAELCRPLYFEYEKEIEFEGIPGWRYRFDDKFFKSQENNPDNACFCPHSNFLQDKFSPCKVDGITPLGLCRSEIPVVLSKPHFLDGDPSLREKVIGLNPDREKHDFYLDVEPNLGVSMRARNRLQLSMHLQPIETFTEPYQHVNEVFVPLLWVDQDATLDEELVDEIKSKLLTPLLIIDITKWVVLGVGVLIAVGGGIFTIYSR